MYFLLIICVLVVGADTSFKLQHYVTYFRRQLLANSSPVAPLNISPLPRLDRSSIQNQLLRSGINLGSQGHVFVVYDSLVIATVYLSLRNLVSTKKTNVLVYPQV